MREKMSNKVTVLKLPDWMTITRNAFDITSNTSIVSATASVSINVVAISFHNNDADGADDTVVKITDRSGGTVLYGGATGAAYVSGRGGPFQLGQNVLFPWFTLTANTALFINPVSSSLTFKRRKEL